MKWGGSSAWQSQRPLGAARVAAAGWWLAVCAFGLLSVEVAAAQQPNVVNGRVETIVATRGLADAVRDLEGRAREAIWIGYAVSILEGRRGSCCDWSDAAWQGTGCCAGCRLEPSSGTSQGVVPGSAARAVRLEGDSTLLVLARLEGGAVGKIRTFAEDCPLDAGGRTVYWLTGVSSSDSLAWLGSFLDGDAPLARSAIAATALHGDPEATARLIAMARAHASGRVRSEALFWLAHRAGERAAAAITDAIVNDPEIDVKKRAVFALTQLPRDEGVPLLIQIARTNRNPEVRKQAIFWLGQSKDPRALQFFEEILTRK